MPRSAIVKPDHTSPPALTQAIENLVCTPRTPRRSTEDSITAVWDRLQLGRVSLSTHSDSDSDKQLVTLSYATYVLGKLVKTSFLTAMKEDRERLDAQSLVVQLAKFIKKVVFISPQMNRNLDSLYSQA